MKSNPISILVLEDHPLMRESICAAIEAEEDMHVIQSDPESSTAFKLSLPNHSDVIFLEEKPDIILLSVGNPGYEDMKVLIWLLEKLQETHILALTSAEVPGQMQMVTDLGAHAVLEKSASRTDLIAKLQTLRSLSFSSNL